LALFCPDGPLGAYRTLCTSLKNTEEKYQYTTKINCHIKARNDEINGEDTIEMKNRSRNLFNKNGYLILEIGSGQDNSVKKIFDKLSSFLKFIKGVHDHKGITRCLIYQYHTEEKI
jgi:methylase of polypeptide subunit release factors